MAGKQLSAKDGRRKVLETREQDEGTLEDLAKRFRVSLSWTKKILAAYSLSGRQGPPLRLLSMKVPTYY